MELGLPVEGLVCWAPQVAFDVGQTHPGAPPSHSWTCQLPVTSMPGPTSDSTVLRYVLQTSAEVRTSLDFCRQIKLFHQHELTRLRRFCFHNSVGLSDGFAA